MSKIPKQQRRRRLTEFDQGVLLAAAHLIRTADQPVYAADILRAFDLTEANCARLDDMDKDELRRLRDDEGLHGLRGLD